MLRNVLIVDDEKIIRTGLRLSVPWEELGFQVTAEAQTALEALKKLEECRIDLALVDIQMPGANGIEFIREMRRLFPHIKALIISGHSDFEYTVAALKLSVCDYLLKPINIAQLVETLEKIRERMDSETADSRIKRGQQAVAGHMLVQRLLGRDFRNREEVDAYCSQCGIPVPLKDYCVVSMKTRDFIGILEQRFDGRRSNLELCFEERLAAAFPDGENAFFASLVGDCYAVIVRREHAAGIRHILYRLAKDYEMKVMIGTGEAFEDIFFMDVSYFQANEAIAAREEGLEATHQAYESRLTYFSDLLIQELEERNFDQALKTAGQAFLDNFAMEQGRMLDWCAHSLYRIVDYFQLNHYPGLKGIAILPIQTMSPLHFMTTLQSAYLEKIKKICDFLKDMKGSSNEVTVNKVCRIVEEEYGDPDLSLQEIAGRLDISYNYLSTVFKQVSGDHFSTYLTQVKMRRARQMMQEGNYKMYEIAERVGYVNAKYFAEQFKKTVGMTPSEYKASIAAAGPPEA